LVETPIVPLIHHQARIHHEKVKDCRTGERNRCEDEVDEPGEAYNQKDPGGAVLEF